MSKKDNKSSLVNFIYFFLIIFVGLILRTIYIILARFYDPLFYAPQMDGLYHHQWAIAIANGIEFISDAYFRAPLYPFFLGLIYKIFGINLFVVRIIQALIGSLSCGLIYLIARRLFTESVAQIAGLVLAFYPLAIYFDGELLIANLLIFLLLLGIFFLLRSYATDRYWFLPGLFLGLAAIARPNVLVYIGVIVGWLLLGFPSQRWRRLVQFLLPVFIIIAPVTIRNYVKSKSVVLIAWQGGTNFYIGNNPYSDGVTAILPQTRGSWWGGYYDAKRLAEQEVGRPLKGKDIDSYWLKQGLKFWQTQPLSALKLLLRKIYLWLSGYEVSNNRDIYFFKNYTFLKFLIFKTGFLSFPFGLLFPLSLVGIYLSKHNWRRLLPVYLFLISYSLSFVIFFVTARYRLPFVVLLIPFAGYGLVNFIKTSRRERVIGIIIFIVAFGLFNFDLARIPPTDKAQNHFLAALGFHETGQIGKTVKELEQALAVDSAVNILALATTVQMELGQTFWAKKLAQAAVRLWPNIADAYGLAGNVYAALNQFDSAKVYFEQAVKLDPYSVQALNNLGNLALTQNDLPLARRYYEQALAIDPNFTLALFHLGLVNYYEGKKLEAHRLWEKVLQLDPKNYKAREVLFRLQ
ncbi:MAG: tetratricopeptide repeat protein [candidate division WOR-3 bacterium]